MDQRTGIKALRTEIKWALEDSAILRARVRERASRVMHRVGYHPVRISPDEREELENHADLSIPLPNGAESILTADNPRLRALRASYPQLDLPVTSYSRWWSPEIVDWLQDLHRFRGDSLFVWHFRELPRITALKYFIYSEYVRSRDPDSLLERLGEDGAFGCWTFDFEGRGRYSRDLLDSVNQIYFLDRHLGILERSELRVLDVGAGYGRLAYRMAQAVPNLSDYCCVDAVPEGTFLSEYYLGHRGVLPPARVVALDRLDQELEPGSFDLAINIHSFSEAPYAAIEWWIALLGRLEVPNVMIISNDGEQLLSFEADGSHRDFEHLFADVGYRRVVLEPVISDPVVEELTGFDFRFHLFELEK